MKHQHSLAVLVLTVLASMASSRLLAAPPASQPATAPVDLVATATAEYDSKLPLLSIVSIAGPMPDAVDHLDKAADPNAFPPDVPNSPLTKAILEGSLKVTGPVSTSPTYAILTGNILSGGQYFVPTSIQTGDHSITIDADIWTDHIIRKSNIIARHLYVISLGKLLAGDYEVHLRCRELMLQEPMQQSLYKPEALSKAAAKFTVRDRPDADPTTTLPATLSETDLVKEPITGDAEKLRVKFPDRSASH